MKEDTQNKEEKIKGLKEEIGVLRFKMKRAQYADHLIDMDKYEAMMLEKIAELELIEEVWKPLVGYEGLYDISSNGRIKRLHRTFDRKRDGYKAEVVIIPEKILSPTLSRKGYLRLNLRKDGGIKRLRVHRLVAITFVGEAPEGKPHVNHKDGNKTNNHFSNLEWCSILENNRHAIELGLVPNQKSGSESPHAKPVVRICMETNKVLETYGSVTEAQDKTGINKQNISHACRNKRQSAGGYYWQFTNHVIVR